MSAVSPTADVPFCQSIRYMKDHMSGVAGGSHFTSTSEGTELTTLGLRGGPGQAVVEKYQLDMIGAKWKQYRNGNMVPKYSWYC